MKTHLKQVRIDAGLTQKELADSIHVSQQTVQQWEAGKTVPQTDRLPDISKALDAPLSSFVFNSKELHHSIEVDITEQVKQEIAALEEKCNSEDHTHHDKALLAFDKLYYSAHGGKCSYQILLTESEYDAFKSMQKIDPDYGIDDFFDFLQRAKWKELAKKIRSGKEELV